MKQHKTALITGASKGLGYALAESLAKQGWNLLITARNSDALLEAKKHLEQHSTVLAKAGDVKDEIHLMELAETLEEHHWKLDLVVNNASALGYSPLRPLLSHSVENLHVVFHTNMIAPISLLQKAHNHLSGAAKVVNISSDAAVEAYETWGAYGGSKAGMDHLTSILSKEDPAHAYYSFDPGDMRTDMHQAAFPGEDISDRPSPVEHAVPALLNLIELELPSGRYTVESLKAEQHV